MNKKGLTLIELLGVIIVIGIIAAISFPVVSNVIEKSRRNGVAENANSMVEAARTYIQTIYIDGDTVLFDMEEDDKYVITLQTLISNGALESTFPGHFGAVKFKKTAANTFEVVGVQYISKDKKYYINVENYDGSLDNKVVKTDKNEISISWTDGKVTE